MRKIGILAVFATLGLTACDQGSDLERAAVFGAAGCAVGEIYEDGNCIKGAAIGAAAGALADDI